MQETPTSSLSKFIAELNLMFIQQYSVILRQQQQKFNFLFRTGLSNFRTNEMFTNKVGMPCSCINLLLFYNWKSMFLTPHQAAHFLYHQNSWSYQYLSDKIFL